MTSPFQLPFKEQCSKKKVQVLLALDENKLAGAIFGADYSKKNQALMTKIKSYLNRMIYSNGIVMSSYGIENNVFKADGFNVSKLPKNLRNFIFDKHDFYEAKSLNLLIIQFICKTFYDKKAKCVKAFLDDVIGCKDNILEDMLTKDELIDTDSLQLGQLNEEINEIKTLLYQQTPEAFDDVEPTPVQNNTYSHNMIDIIENIKYSILYPQLINEFGRENILGFTKNGLVISNKVEKDQVLKQLTNLTGFKNWLVSHETITFRNDEVEEAVNSIEPQDSYGAVKERFEKNNFIIKNPFFLCTETNDNIATYSISDFRLLNKPIKYMSVTNDKKPKKVEFIPGWMEDETRRSYEEFEFIPDLKLSNPGNYNLFKGFAFSKYGNHKHQQWAIDKIETIARVISNDDKLSQTYLLKFFAHMIQKPTELPGVIIVMKSITEGVGKDLFINCIGKLIGKDYIVPTDNLDEFFGQFNKEMEKMMLMLCNETESIKGHKNKERLKAQCTNTTTTINAKGKHPFKVNNYNRIVLLSNNTNPIAIGATDRRYVVFEASNEKQSDEWFAPLYQAYQSNNPDVFFTLYKYFNEMDIEDFNPRDRPTTKAYTQMKERNTPPFTEFMYSCIVDDEFNKYFARGSYMEHKETKNTLIKAIPIMDAFNKWKREVRAYCDDLNNRQLKSRLSEFNVFQKHVLINGKTERRYEFKLCELETRLKELVVKDTSEVMEIDENDYNMEIEDTDGITYQY